MRGAVRELALRVFRDFNRLPWTAEALHWRAQASEPLRREFDAALGEAIRDPHFDVAYGAVLLATAVAETTAELDSLLFAVALQHTAAEVRRLAGAYLLGTPRTRPLAMRRLADDPDLGAMARQEAAILELMPRWLSLLETAGQEDPAGASVWQFAAAHPKDSLALQQAFLDRFETADGRGRQTLVALVLAALDSPQPEVQTLACDLLTYPALFDAVRSQAQARLAASLERLATSSPEPVSSYAGMLLANLGAGATAGEDVSREQDQALLRSGWELVHRLRLPGREAERFSAAHLPLRAAAQAYLQARYAGQVYRHQLLALQQVTAGADVCLTTGTASGKSMVFYTAGIELLARNPMARIAAIYPLKALAREQEQRWAEALAGAGLSERVGRIEGGVAVAERARILRQCRVVLFTPDVLHAWLLGTLGDGSVRTFLKHLRLVVVDEVHVYTGVFGSNAAYLFRRLQHAAHALSGGATLRFIAASATVAEPEHHLHQLFARPFCVVGSEADTSPSYPLDVLLVRPRHGLNLNTAVPELLRELVRDRNTRFLAFVDSRRQTEQLAAILARPRNEDDEVAVTADSPPAGTAPAVMPYRGGYEEADREHIQSALTRGDMRGVVSTSALELGLDIPGINTVVLIGMPHSATSLRQRIGRAGRSAPGRVIVVDAGGATDSLVFRQPQRLLDRPLAQSALYLENRRIQYIHALCFASAGGECDTLAGTQPDVAVDPQITSPVSWPDGFLDLCRRERLGDVPPDLQPLKTDAGGDPWHTFPLRDVGSQFQVERHGPEPDKLGQLSFAQLMREAYPGAVYYYLARPYRVIRVSPHEKRVVVRPERHYTTDPLLIPPQVFPNLQGESFHRGTRFADLVAVECDTYISEVMYGYAEHRGSQKLQFTYPNDYWKRDRFTRNFAATGVLLHHPVLRAPGVQLEALAQWILEAFFLVAPFDRSEVAASVGRHHEARMCFQKGERFIALYDQTYGSLRLSGRLLDDAVLAMVLVGSVELAEGGALEEMPPLVPASLEALRQLAQCAQAEAMPLSSGTNVPAMQGERVMVILPGSVGWIVTDSDQEFQVDRVFFHPKIGLAYRGKRVGERQPEGLEVLFPVDCVRPIPQLSKLGEYNLDTGELKPVESE